MIMEGSGDVRSGSFSTEMGSLLDVRFPPVSDQTGDIAGGPFRAMNGLTLTRLLWE